MRLKISKTLNGPDISERLAGNQVGLDLSGIDLQGGKPGDIIPFDLYLSCVSTPSEKLYNKGVHKLGVYLDKIQKYNGDHDASSDLADMLNGGFLSLGYYATRAALPLNNSQGSTLANRLILGTDKLLAIDQIYYTTTANPYLLADVGFSKTIGSITSSSSSYYIAFNSAAAGINTTNCTNLIGCTVKNITKNQYAQIKNAVDGNGIYLHKLQGTGAFPAWSTGDSIEVKSLTHETHGFLYLENEDVESYLTETEGLFYGQYMRIRGQLNLPANYSYDGIKQVRLVFAWGSNCDDTAAIVPPAFSEPSMIPAGSNSLNLEHQYKIVDPSVMIISKDFTSDTYGGPYESGEADTDSGWTTDAEAESGDFSINNVGTVRDPRSLSRVLRYQTKEEVDTLTLTWKVPFSTTNGFHPDFFYIGSHNMPEGTICTLKAYVLRADTSPVYTQTISLKEKESYSANFNVFRKCQKFELVFEMEDAQIVKIGRVILGQSFKLKPENNIQESFTTGYTHHKTEMFTEFKTRLTNSLFFAKKLNFSIQVNIDTQNSLHQLLQQFIELGNGNAPLIIIPDPRKPNDYSIYGILTEPPQFEEKELGIGLYTFDVEELK